MTSLRRWSSLDGRVRSNPRDLQAQLKAAELSAARGKHEEALQHLRRAALLDPGRGETFFRLGELLCAAQHWRPAAQAFQQALERGVEPARCHLQLSMIYEKLAQEEAQASQARQP